MKVPCLLPVSRPVRGWGDGNARSPLATVLAELGERAPDPGSTASSLLIAS